MRTRSRLAGVVLLVVLTEAAVGSLVGAGPAYLPIAAARQQAQGTSVTVEGLVALNRSVKSKSSKKAF